MSPVLTTLLVFYYHTLGPFRELNEKVEWEGGQWMWDMRQDNKAENDDKMRIWKKKRTERMTRKPFSPGWPATDGRCTQETSSYEEAISPAKQRLCWASEHFPRSGCFLLWKCLSQQTSSVSVACHESVCCFLLTRGPENSSGYSPDTTVWWWQIGTPDRVS